VSIEEEPKQPSHIGWIITQGETPALDAQGRLQIFGSPIHARLAAQYQGRDVRYCTIAVQPGDQPRRGSLMENMARTILEKNTARQQSKSPKAPRVRETADPEREMKRAMEAAARRHQKRP